ncbi:MAG TPA: 50S ribosomal protein L13, partial [Candidatus Sumerlaeota bacterium]|nr:50S ribosomal protein L13 [Candidatus Sumerlaeota bacterium]
MGYTKSAKAEALPEKWYVVDARDQVLGRLASDVAHVLRGKHLTNYTPHANMRTHVIVLNADKIRLTGDKWETKLYHHHTGWVGHLRETNARKLNERKPGELVRKAVWGMLPKNRLGHATMTRLRIFSGDQHPHQAQKPEPL